MIRLQKVQEGYDLNKIRSFMKKLGFEQTETPLTYQYEYSGMIAFKKDLWKIEFTYPSELLIFAAFKGVNGSWFSAKLDDIKAVECTNRTIHVTMKNGNEVQLWNS